VDVQSLIDALRRGSPYLPLEFVGGFAEMPSLFRAISTKQQLPKGYSNRMIALVPEPIRSLPCFLDQLTGLWRYQYGEPLALSGRRTMTGTHMFHEVERLFEVICCASWRLPPPKLDAYLARLADRAHHEDVLVEFAPILHIDYSVAIEHEHFGLGSGNRTIDWRIQAAGRPLLLLEVKNRTRDLVESFEAINSLSSDSPVPEPNHNHSILFRSTQVKFRSRPTTEAIQAVWIKTGLLQEEEQLKIAFGELDPTRIHAAILGSWEPEGYVLARDAGTKRSVLKILRIKDSTRLVFKRK
jgi:hypothetical protein